MSDILAYCLFLVVSFNLHHDGILFLVVNTMDCITLLDFISEDRFGQGVFHIGLYGTFQWTGAILDIISFVGDELAGLFVHNKLVSNRFHTLVQTFQLDVHNLHEAI